MEDASRRRSLSAFDLSCRWLARRPHSELELRRRLEALGFSGGAVDKAVRRLQDLRFLDDDGLARSRGALLAERGYGDAWIQRDLEQRGLPAEAIGRALGELEPEGRRAEQWLQRRRPRGSPEARWRALLQRGFRPETAEDTLGSPAPVDDDGWLD